MKWKKLGNLFCPDNNFPWMKSHAANPFAVRDPGNLFRIFFTSRDAENRSHISCLRVDAQRDFNVIDIAPNPVLIPGALGLFDDSGVAMGCLLRVDGIEYIYYLGWNLKVTVPWLNTIGLAKYNREENLFEKYSLAPLLDRSQEDPFSLSYPSILLDNGVYRMWYGSNLSWGREQHEMQHVIKYAESADAIHWNRAGQIHIGLEHSNEYAISKPFVMKDERSYLMWYSYRGRDNVDTYRIGHAESHDGFEWERRDDLAGIDVSGAGWDSEMIEYPFVFDYDGQRYMLYNGNAYGKTGFGLAVLE